MSDPTRLPDPKEADATLHAQTEEINRLERLLAQQGRSAPVAEIDEPAPPTEKLFSRRTLIGWAFATLVVVFIIRMVIPVAFETAKEEIISRMKEPTSNTDAPVVAPAPTTTVVIPAPAAPATPAAPAGTAAPAPTAGPTVITIVKKR